MNRPLLILFLFGFTLSCSKEETAPNAKIPDVQSFDPAEGVPGVVVTITGKDLITPGFSTVVKFGPVEAVVQSATATSITALVPHVVDNAPIVVITGDQTGMSSMAFEIQPFIRSINPGSGPIGAHVEIDGGGFFYVDDIVFPLPTPQVYFNGVLATVDGSGKATNLSQMYLGVNVPSGATTGYITVVVSGKTATSPMEFVVN